MKGFRYLERIEDFTREEAQKELKSRRYTLEGLIKSYISWLKKDDEFDKVFEPFAEVEGKTYSQMMADDIKEDIKETKYIISLLERKAY